MGFVNVDNNDTYDSGIPAAVSYWANATDHAIQNNENAEIKYDPTTGGGNNRGRFTFFIRDGRNMDLYVLSRT